MYSSKNEITNCICFNLQAGKNNAFVTVEFSHADDTNQQGHHVGAGLQTRCRLLLNC